MENISQQYKSLNESLFDSLFKYIPKNKTLREAIDKIDPQESGLQELITAVKSGSLEASIFSNKNYDIYLLYLMQTGEVKFWPGITLYIYFIALAQFTDKQPLKEQDQNYKLDGNLNTIQMVKDGKLTSEGDEYCKAVVNGLKKINFEINLDQLKKFILNLSVIEQKLLKIPRHAKLSKDIGIDAAIGYHNLTYALIKNLPLLQISEHDENIYIFIPSMSVINYLLQAISHKPIMLRPSFGTVTESDLTKMHERGEHPLSLYSTYVKYNLRHAHGCSHFFYILLHDIAHAFWGSMLTLQQRQFLFNTFIPELKNWQSHPGDQKFMPKVMETVIYHAVDFDLTPIEEFADPKTRFHLYLNKAFHVDGKAIYFLFPILSSLDKLTRFQHDPNTRIGSMDDVLYFLICKTIYDPNIKIELKECFKILLNIINTNITFKHRQKEVIVALQIMAKNAAVSGLSSLFAKSNEIKPDLSIFFAIPWSTLLDITHKTTDCKELEQELLSRSLHDSLLSLITEYGLIFLPPLIPLTDDKRKELITFLNIKNEQFINFFNNKNQLFPAIQTGTQQSNSFDNNPLSSEEKKCN